MPKGKKVGGKDWVPGQSGNPNGRPPLPKELKELKELTKTEVETALNKLIHMTADELKELRKNPNTSALHLMVIAVTLEALQKGDHYRLDFLLNRIVGKVKDQVEHSGKISLEELVVQSQKEDLPK